MSTVSALKKSLATSLSVVLVTTGIAAPAAWGDESVPVVQESVSVAETGMHDNGSSALVGGQDNQVPVSSHRSAAEAYRAYGFEFGSPYRIAPLIVWGGIAVLGLLIGGGLIFYAYYSSHEEKQTLIDRCYDNGGTPVIDSRDSAGLEGTTDSGAAKTAGGYRFECQKK